MMGGSLGVLALLLLQISPASSFGGVPLAGPSSKAVRGGTPPTSSAAVSQTRCGWAPTPVRAKSGLSSRRSRLEKGGRRGDRGWARFAGEKTEDVDGKNKKSAVAAKPAAKKKSSGAVGGWDWGFKSTPKKTAAKPADKKVAAATAASKAKQQEEAKLKRQAEDAVVAEQDPAVAEAAEKERKADARAKAAQEKAKAKKEAEEEAAAMKAARIAQAKRAEEIAAVARGDVPKASKKAAGKATDEKAKEETAKAKTTKPVEANASAEAEPAKAGPGKPKGGKAETAHAKATTKKKSSGGMGGWDWGFKSVPEGAAKPPAGIAKTPTKPATGAAKGKAKKPTATDRAAEATKELESADAAAGAEAAAAAAEAAAAKSADAAKAKAAEDAAAAAAQAEEEKAKKELAAARAAQEKRAEAIAAKARGDVPEPKKKKTPAKAPTPAPAPAPVPEREEITSGIQGKGDEKGRTEEKEVRKEKATVKEAEATKATKAKTEATKKEKTEAGGEEEAEGDAAAPANGADAAAVAGGTKGEAVEEATRKPVKEEISGGGGGGGGIWELFGAPTSKMSSSPKRKESSGSSSLTLTKPETIVVVTGATGRVGSLTVRRLLELYPQVLVRAVVNDYSKGCRLLKDDIDKYGIKLEVVTADLGGSRSVAKAVEGASAVVFCASGFAQNLSPIQRLANAVRLTLNPSSVADVEGVREVASALKATKKVLSRASKAAQDKASADKGSGGRQEGQAPQPLYPDAPRFVLLSSAAVTRPNWSDEEKALYPLAADVPIVKLNPLNILTVKAEGEKELREVGIPYAVVRPCGLNDDHPKGRPLFSVGDTAAGRICREDVADVLVRCLATPEATGKTFEVQSLPGFEKVAPSVKTNSKGGIDQALAGLPTDEALENDPNMLKSFRQFTYPVLTQLRPVPLSSQGSPEKKD